MYSYVGDKIRIFDPEVSRKRYLSLMSVKKHDNMAETKPMSIKERIAMLNSNKAAPQAPVVPTGHVWTRPEAEAAPVVAKPPKTQRIFVKRTSVPGTVPAVDQSAQIEVSADVMGFISL